MQTTLRMFSEEGFIGHFFDFLALNFPGVAKKDPFAVEVAGAMLFSHVAGIYCYDFGFPPASLYVTLIAKPRSGKGAILGVLNNVITMMRSEGIEIWSITDPTPAGLVQALAGRRNKHGEFISSPKWNSVVIWEDMGFIAKSKQKRDQYNGLDKILNNTYYSKGYQHIRKDSEREVILPPRSYRLSCLWDCTPEEWGKIESFFGGETGFSRRMFPLRTDDTEFPYFESFKYKEESVDHLSEMIRIAEELQGSVHLVKLDLEFLEGKLNALEDRIKKALVSDFTKRLLAIRAVDNPNLGYNVTNVIGSENTTLSDISIPNITLITTLTNSNKYNIVTEIKTERASLELSYKHVITNVIKILTRFSYLKDEKIQRSAEKTREYFKEHPVSTQREWWLTVLGGIPAKIKDEVKRTLEGIGVINVAKFGRGELIIDPHISICFNCIAFEKCQLAEQILKEVGELKDGVCCDDFQPAE